LPFIGYNVADMKTLCLIVGIIDVLASGFMREARATKHDLIFLPFNQGRIPFSGTISLYLRQSTTDTIDTGKATVSYNITEDKIVNALRDILGKMLNLSQLPSLAVNSRLDRLGFLNDFFQLIEVLMDSLRFPF